MKYHFAAALAATLAAASPAEAAQRAINIPLTGFELGGTAGAGSLFVQMPKAGNPTVATQFVLPPDYKEGTAVQLRMYFGSAGACAAYLDPLLVVRTRNGKPTAPTTTGVKMVGGNLLTFAVQTLILRKTIEFRPPTFPGFTGQKIGDTIAIQIVRDGTQMTDTCVNPVFLRSAEVRYTVK